MPITWSSSFALGTDDQGKFILPVIKLSGIGSIKVFCSAYLLCRVTYSRSVCAMKSRSNTSAASGDFP